MAKTVKLGRVQAVTVFDNLKEALGDGLDAVGAALAAGDPRPRPFDLSIPVRGDRATDTDAQAAGNRMRRQLRALMENTPARLQGLYFSFTADTEINAFLLVGGGDLEYADGGPTFAEYKLTLTDCNIAGRLRTHRPARRLELYDRRLSTTPRDILGTLYSVDFAAQTALAMNFLPVTVTDPTGLARAVLAPVARATIDGNLGLLTGRTHGEVVSYEQAETDMGKADVVIVDRQGAAVANLVTNPSFEVDTAGWSVAAGLVNAGATINSVADSGVVGSRAAEVVTNGSLTNEGTFFFLNLVAGTTYSVRFSLKRMAGTGTISGYVVRNGAPFTSYPVATGVTPAGWTSYTATITPSATDQYALVFQVNQATATTFRVDGCQIAASPTVVAYADGDTAGYVWEGTAHNSPTLGPVVLEEVYGPDQPLTAADVPPLQNGICRTRWVTATGALALDAYVTGTGYVEQARVGIYRDSPAGTETQYTTLIKQAVVEWTPERAVIRATLGIGATDRVDVYLTLQRGWTAPRVECYASWTSAGNPGVAVRLIPFTAGATTLGRSSGTVTIGSTDRGNFAALQPWLYLSPTSPNLSLHAALLQTSVKAIDRADTALYGATRNGISIVQPNTVALAGYVSVTFGIGPIASVSADATQLGQTNLYDARSVPELVAR